MTETQTAQPGRWIGIDLNTTGYVAVVADPGTGFTAKLGREARIIHDGFNMERKKLKNKKKTRNLKRLNKRETGQLKDLNKFLSREIVRIAAELGCGIKFEQLSGNRLKRRSMGKIITDFSINNWYFRHLCQMVENRAIRQGISVIYVDPSFTSQICSRCGTHGHRHRKVFQCPECGFIGHADVNAAFNIARSPVNIEDVTEKAGFETEKAKIKKKIRRINAGKRFGRTVPSAWSAFPSESFSLLFESRICEV